MKIFQYDRHKKRVQSVLLSIISWICLCTVLYSQESIVLSDGSKREVHESPPYLRIALNGAISTLDPGLTVDTSSIELTEQLFLGLTDFDPSTYEVVPELATHWDVSEDGLVYHFYLRKDAYWSDGTPITAHDIVWAVQRNLSPEIDSPVVFMLYVLQNAKAFHQGTLEDPNEVGVRAINDWEVEFILNNPAAYFPALAGLWIYRPLPRNAVEQFGDQWTKPYNIQTSGSYHLDTWDKGTSLILKKNPKYFDAAKVSIEEVHYYIINENSLGLTLYETNDLDILGGSYLKLPLREIPRIKGNRLLNKEFTLQPQFCNYYYGFNTQKPPVDNPLVRRAICAAIDRQLLIDVILKDREPARTFTRPPVFGAVDPEAGVGIYFDPEQAKAWLAEAGYPDGEGFPVLDLVYNTTELHQEIALAVQTFLKHYLNIEVAIKGQQWDEFMETITQPNTPHMYRFGWCSDYPDANNWLSELFHPTYSPNRIGWNNAEFKEVVEEAQRISDPDERKSLYYRAEQILTEEESAVFPLFFDTAAYLVKSRLKSWYSMALGGQHIRNWVLEDDQNP